jgi:hypothetical protein
VDAKVVDRESTSPKELKTIRALLKNTGIYWLSGLGDALAALANKLEPLAAAEIGRGLSGALGNPQKTDSDRLSGLGNALAALANRLGTQAAVIARQNAQRLAAALENPQKTDSYRLSRLGNALAAFCRLCPSARRTHLLALSNMLLQPVVPLRVTFRRAKAGSMVFVKSGERKERSYDRKVLAEVCAQLSAADLAEVLKYPFCTGEAEQQIVLEQLKAKTHRDFGGDVWKFVEQAEAMGIKDVGNPAQRPSVKDAVKELDAL